MLTWSGQELLGVMLRVKLNRGSLGSNTLATQRNFCELNDKYK